MAIKTEEYNSTCVIALDGEFAGVDLVAVKASVTEAIEKKQLVDFVIDFERCDFIDSEGLSTLIWVKQQAERLFGKVKLVALDENCRKIMEITRLWHRFEIHTDLAAALKRVA